MSRARRTVAGSVRKEDDGNSYCTTSLRDYRDVERPGPNPAAGPWRIPANAAFASHHARTPHDGFRFPADLAGHGKRIALLKRRQEELD